MEVKVSSEQLKSDGAAVGSSKADSGFEQIIQKPVSVQSDIEELDGDLASEVEKDVLKPIAKSSRSRAIKFSIIGLLLAGGAGLAAVSFLKPEWLGLAGTSPAPAAAGADKNANAPQQDRVVANVNGVDINESEVLPIMAAGVDRAVAIDRYINKVLAAQLAEKEYQKDAEVALRAAEREVLSTLYMQKRTQAVNDGVTDDEIKSYYDKNVRDEDYKRYKLRYYLTQDVTDGENIAKAILNKERDALAKLKYMKEGTDNMLMAGEMPYGLGQVVRSLKEGETSRPIVLRNGVFVLNLEEVKAQPKPTIDKVKGEIKNLLVAERIGLDLSEKRKSAKIELK
jgi:hypothetical protein